MSRSCKKTPVSKGRCKNFRWAKRAANKRVRRAKTLWGKSKAFRKISETWDICDWKFYGERSWNPNREEKKSLGKMLLQKMIWKRCMKPWMNYEPRSRKEILSWGQKTETLK